MDDNDYKKQRRNLLAISSIIISIELLGLDFNQINILGNKATITQPQNFNLILWLIFSYVCLRYFQVFNETVLKTIFSSVNSRIAAQSQDLAKAKAMGVEKWVTRTQDPNHLETKYNVIEQAYLVGEKVYQFKFRVESLRQDPNNKNKKSVQSGDEIIKLSRREQARINIQNYLYFFLLRTQFTEYLWPPLFALLAILSPFWTNLFSVG